MYRSTIAPIYELLQKSRTIRLFILWYFICLASGWLLLQIPVCQKASIPSLDTLFTAVSAVSTTGLQTVDIGTVFSFTGQVIIILLIQFGGVGYMVFSSLIVLSLKQKLSVFENSASFQDITLAKLIKQVIWYSIVCEVGGVIVLYWFFKDAGQQQALWNAVFHSISAFCTAGYSLLPTSLETYAHHFGMNMAISVLSILGAVGFFLCSEMFNKPLLWERGGKFLGRIFSCFTTITITGGGILFLLLGVFFAETSQFQRVLVSFFQAMSAITTVGFNTIDMRTVPQSALLLLCVLMLIGASITGSGVHMKRTSVPILLKLLMNMLTVKETLRARSQKVFAKRVQIATYTFTNFFLVVSLPFWILVFIEGLPTLSLFFEAVSALCTVGLSTGITSQLTALGKGLIILLMLTGRTGVLLFAFAISTQKISRKKAAYV